MEFSEVTSVIKALIVAQKGGMPLENLEEEFIKLEGRPIPYLKMGYPSLFHYLRAVKEIRSKKDDWGNSILIIEDKKVDHLNSMIGNQKPAKKKKKKKGYHQNFIPHKRRYRRQGNQWDTDYQRADNYSYSGSSGYRNSPSTSFEEHQPPKIFIDPRKRITDIHEPILNGRQMIGDDFFLQIAIRNLQVPIWRKAEKTALYSGLCRSGQSIRDCTKQLENLNSISGRVIIMLGAVDIYQRRSFCQMKEDFKELLDLLEVKFNISRNEITICTVPPLANLNFMLDFEKTSTLRSFNNWLRKIVIDDYDLFWGVYAAYNLVDFYENFTDDIDAINYDYFQDDARNVSGIRHPWVLFNRKGRRVALELLM